MNKTLLEYLDHWKTEYPNEVWMRYPQGDNVQEWSWLKASEQIHAIAAWQQTVLGEAGVNVGLLSRNRPHWFMADLGTIAAGNVTVPMFTTLPKDTAAYVMEFTDMQLLFVGENENWDKISTVLPKGLTLVALPGVELDCEHLRWDDIINEYKGQRATYQAQPTDLVSIVFTSGTTGMPKGVMQTHESNVIPIDRFKQAFATPPKGRFFSYLPLSHIAERQVVEYGSLINGGSVYFNENLTTLLRDLPACRPHMMFGPPRVWEQLQQGIINQFGSQAALSAALAENKAGVGELVRAGLGFDAAMYLLTAAAPTPPALIEWYGELGIELMEGFGQTEAMGVAANTAEHRKIGSIGRVVGDVEVRLSDEGELLVNATGLATGYYKMPDKTAETFVEGWLHTGDKARIDEEGFIFITGRVKDYFKTIQGKFVAPTAIENSFSESMHSEQCCLLGRGYSKTVIVCVLSAMAQKEDADLINNDLIAHVKQLNQTVEKHARVGAIIVSCEPWTIDNGMLTPTMKIRREQIEERFGDLARALAHDAAVKAEVLLTRQ